MFFFTTNVMESCDMYLSGSYPYAQAYECNTYRKNLLTALKSLKNKDPSLEMKATNEKDSMVTLDGQDNYFYDCYFRIPLHDSIIVMHSVVTADTIPAIIKLDSTMPENFNTCRKINTKDFSKEENEQMKELFEKKVLNRINVEWKRE